MDFNSVIVTVECITTPPCPTAETERDRTYMQRAESRGDFEQIENMCFDYVLIDNVFLYQQMSKGYQITTISFTL